MRDTITTRGGLPVLLLDECGVGVIGLSRSSEA